MTCQKMLFNKNLFSFLFLFSLGLSLATVVCPSYAYAEEQKTEQEIAQEQKREKKAQEAAQFARLKMDFINELTQLAPDSIIPKSPIITSTEWTELDMRKLIAIAGTPITAFGNPGMLWLSMPVANHNEISRRQNIIRKLVTNETISNQLYMALHAIKKSEDPLIMYWAQDPKLHYFIRKNILPDTEKPKDLSWFGEKKYALSQATYGEPLNKISMSVPGLEAAAAAPYFNLIGLGLETYISYCLLEMMWRPTDDLINPAAWVRAFMPSKDKGVDALKRLFLDVWKPISPYDKMQDSQRPGRYRVWEYTGSEWQHVEKTIDEMGYLHGIEMLLNGTAKDKFMFGSDFAQRKIPNIGENGKAVAGIGFTLLGALQYYAYRWGYFNICNIWNDGKRLTKYMNKLHASLVDIAKMFRALKNIQEQVSKDSIFKDTYAQKVLDTVMGSGSHASPAFKELMKLFETKTFDNADSVLYSRGRVLRAHILLQQVKDREVIWLMQAIAELDGYATIARLMKAYEGKDNKFVFAEFVDSDKPVMKVTSCWEPLAPTKNPVVNDVRLGVDGKPVRMIITGPNGGGKSTFLKSVGHSVIMAQSWGIVPASRAELTLFNQLRTSLDPKEDLSAGISKFTAQKERIENIGTLMKESDSDYKMLVILDEPYTGTTDEQMAERVYKFGHQAISTPHVALCIATHVEKPTRLAAGKNFVNYQIEIEEPQIGKFVRTFKIKDGVATWWFKDKARATRFVDWISPINMRRNPGGQVAVTGGVQAGRAAAIAA